MALNSMYPDGWFALGAAALKVSCHANYGAYKLVSFIIINLSQILLALENSLRVLK